MLVVLLWTILIFVKSPGASLSTVTAAAAAAASGANESITESDEVGSASGALVDVNGTVVSAVWTEMKKLVLISHACESFSNLDKKIADWQIVSGISSRQYNCRIFQEVLG